MAARTAFTAAAFAFAVAGCTLVPPRGLVEKKCDASTDGKECLIAIVVDARSGDACEGVKLRTDPDVLVLEGRSPVRINLVLPDKFAFCAGDGMVPARLLDVLEIVDLPDRGVKGGVASPAGGAQSCRNSLPIGWANRERNRSYPYALWFHDSTGKTKCKIDPWIRNGL
jgi:hypothetical protein